MKGASKNNLNVKTAEKLFNRKASPESKLSVKEFLKKKPSSYKIKAEDSAPKGVASIYKKGKNLRATTAMGEPKKGESYHQKAQTFIKSAKELGMKPKVKNGVLTASPEKRSAKVFNAATQFGKHLAEKAENKIRRTANKLTKPIVRRQMYVDNQMAEMDRKARSGEFNQ